MTSHEAIVADLQAHRQEPERGGRKPRTQLTSPPPPAGASSAQLADWITVALALGADPLKRTVRYGRHDDARMVLELASGARIVFDRQAEAFDPRTLVRRVVLATGQGVPTYGAADAQTIATALVRAADLLDEDDDRNEAREWALSFLVAAERNTITVADASTPEGRYEALSALVSWKAPGDLSPYAPVAERSALVLDTASGARLARTSDVAAHVRQQIGRPIPWPALHGRLIEVGWQHRGQVEQRQPRGHARVKVHAYAIPAGWEHS